MAYGQTLPTLATQQARLLRATNNKLAKQILSIWRANAANDFESSLDQAVPAIVQATENAQQIMLDTAQTVTPKVLEYYGTRLKETGDRLNVGQWLGVNGNGETLGSVLYESAYVGRQAISQDQPLETALKRIERNLATKAVTAVSDTQRSAALASAQIYAPRARVIRVLNPPSCMRCVILAGTGNVSLRHPNCDCTSIYAEKPPKEAYVNPYDYLDELDDDELAHALGSRANAEAYKDGADLYQLVNAYRAKGAVSAAQVGGYRVKHTLEGMTKRGFAYRRMRQAGIGSSTRVRLMPETIYKLAQETGADARQMLKDYGWIL